MYELLVNGRALLMEMSKLGPYLADRLMVSGFPGHPLHGH